MRLGAALGAIVDWQPALEQPDAEFQRVLEAIVHEMSTLRLRLLELPADAMAGYPAFFRPEAIARGEATLRALGCGFTVHLPYGGLDLASANETERGRSVATVLAAA
ncbi:MAG: hypothetical protein HYY05_06890, partial [Chloroflexi bacterium]|nr:hypothetical protein [Chloroflexota bacterium]